jgi:nucleotide-binding universal stress UspA family protein
MFTRILVPLDGSRMAEAALPAAEAFRRAFSSSLTLIHVLESRVPKAAHGEPHLREKREAEEYLKDAALRYFPPGAKIQRHVHTGGISDVPDSLAAHSRELGQDLIVMCVHGRGGFGRMVEGNLAQRVVGTRTVPVLLVKPSGVPFAPCFRKILVALDGKPGHEQGLPIAEELARKTCARILLATVVPTWATLMGEREATGRLLPGAMAEFLTQSETTAARYLAEQAARLAGRGIGVDTEIRRGKPARQIARLARESGVDLALIGTHGRMGTKAFWAGSVAQKIIGSTSTPLLLIPPDKGER